MDFDSGQLREVLQYVKAKYGSELEFLWAKSPDSAILRHSDSPKWYGLVMIIPREKLGLSGEERAAALNLKCDPKLKGSLLDEKSYFPAYHMNKEHWITILLDSAAPTEEICSLIDMSHALTGK